MKAIRIDRATYGIKSVVYSQVLRDTAKETPGITWSPRERAWVGYPDAVMVLASRLENEYGESLDVRKLPPPVADWGAEPEPLIPVAWKGLRDYQRAGVKFAVDQGPTGALLADAMGLGKSLQAIIAARAFKMKTVVVCPSFALGVWARRPASALGPGELAKWWPKARVAVCEGITPATLLVRETKVLREKGIRGLPAMLTREGLWRSPTDDVDVVVVSCDVVHAWVDSIVAWSRGSLCLIVDEIHQYQSAKSRRYYAVRHLSSKARVSIGLTGTPVTNYLEDLWTLVDILSPGRYGKSFFTYGCRHCDGHQVQVTPEKVVWKWDGSSHLDELNARLQYNMLRRTKRDVKLELPPKERTVLDVEVPARARIVAQQDVFKNPRQLRRLLDQAANAKMPRVLDVLSAHAQAGSRVVCFTHRRNIAEYLTEELLKRRVSATWIHGGLSRKARDRRVAEARGLVKAVGSGGKKSQGAPGHVLCVTIDTMGTGVDLSYASVGVFAELSWEWAKLAQAEDRLHRFGQTLLTVIQYIVARGTTDEIVISAVLERLRQSDDVVGPSGEGLAEDLDTAPKGRKALELLADRMMAQAKKMWEAA